MIGITHFRPFTQKLFSSTRISLSLVRVVTYERSRQGSEKTEPISVQSIVAIWRPH
jgi:hypothetical protein